MATNEEVLSPDYLRRNLPAAWNTPGEEDIHARLGYDVIGELFRITHEWLGDGGLEPADLPLRVELDFTLRTSDDGLIVRVAKRQGDEPKPDPKVGTGEPDEDRPALTARYLDEHAVTTWNDERDRDGYAVLGYLLELELIGDLIDAGGADGDEAHRTASLTINTTRLAGGCVIVCGGRGCTHKHRP